MAATENRHIRIEDWKGNVYFPASDSSSSTAGSISDSSAASTDPSSSTYTDGEKVADSKANGGTAIILSSGTTRKTLFSTQLSGIPFGTVSISLRLKSSKGSGTTNLIEVNFYFVDNSGSTPVSTLLETKNINGEAIGKANEYVTIGTSIDFKGTSTGSSLLKVELILLPNTGTTVYFDQLATAMSLPSSSSVKVFVDGGTVVFET